MDCIISGISQGVYISDNCGLSAGCRIYSFVNHYKSSRNPANHDIYFTPMVSHDRQCIIEGPVFIGANTGLALNTIILPGTRIGCDSFIAINSMVIGGTFDENILIAGCPGKIRGCRYPNK
jgi:acetyltransferase-like isoleucine patch superfamily enzyme